MVYVTKIIYCNGDCGDCGNCNDEEKKEVARNLAKLEKAKPKNVKKGWSSRMYKARELIKGKQ